MMRRGKMVSLAIAIAVLGLVGAVSAQARLNPSFGNGGVVQVNPPIPPEATSQNVERMAASAAGDSFVLSRAWGCNQGNCVGPTELFHYGPEGALDTAFSGSGSYRLPGEWLGVPTLTVDSSGRPLIAVQPEQSGRPVEEYSLTRLLPDGQPDPGFGQEGTVTLPCQDCGIGGESIIPGREGTLLLAGSHAMFGTNPLGGGPTGTMLTLQSLGADGAPDSTYGTGGTATIGLPKRGAPEYSARSPEGGVYLGGQASSINQGGNYLIRVSAKGRLDSRFLHAAASSLERLNSINGVGTEVRTAVVRPRGKLDLFGSSAYSVGFELRLLPSGKLDRKFGKRGLRMLPVPVVTARLGSSGAEMGISGESGSPRAVLRILPGGRLDPKFGTQGEPLPEASGDAGFSIVPVKNKRAIVLDLGYRECRLGCASVPKLFSFLEGR